MIVQLTTCKRIFAVVLLLILSSVSFSQIYTVHQIQYNPSNPGGPSPYVYQHLRIAAIVTGVGVNTGAGGTRSFFVQDRDTTGYHGLLTRTTRELTFNEGDSVFLTGTVVEWNGQTQLNIFTTDTIMALQLDVWEPLPANVTVSSIAVAFTAEPFEGMLVKVSNVRVTAVATDGVTISDGTSSINVKGFGVGGRWNLPLMVGDSLQSITGNLRQMTPTTYQLEPRSDIDFESYGNNAPIISNVSNSPFTPTPSDSVFFRATVTDIETAVSAVWLTFRLNSSLSYDSLPMTSGDNRSYSVVAGPFPPSQSQVSNTIRYIVHARDSEGAVAAFNERSFTVAITNSEKYQRIIAYPDSFLYRTISLEGQLVYVAGRPTSSGSHRTDAYLVDTTTCIGLYISERDAPETFFGMVRGAYVRMNASVTTYNGYLEINGSNTFTVLDTLPLPRPIPIQTGDTTAQRHLYQTGNPLYYTSGSWIQTTGTIVSVDSGVGGGTNILLDDSTGSLLLRVWNYTGLTRVLTASGDSIPLTELVGRTYTIRGVAAVYNSDFHLLAGYVEDFIEQGSSAPEQEITFLPQTLTIEKIYPNPLNAAVSIAYSLSRPENVTITIFDVSGREIESFVRNHPTAGLFYFHWNASTLPSGSYLCRMQTANSSISRRITIVK
ncbi:MAG: T9SS type A sorting domain-containing protein [bacterium]|nr:T9SS type A sorting domain-containing protein [bacterium]